MTDDKSRALSCGPINDNSLDDGTLARAWMPSPGPMCSLAGSVSSTRPASAAMAANLPRVDHLFVSCRSPEVGLNEADYADAAASLGVEVAVIMAVAEVESKGKGFDDQGRPTILYERHYFHRFTAGKYSVVHPDLSNASAGGYGKFSAQYGKLARAYALDPTAALKSASWGRFQIMGANFREAGYASVQQMVNAMSRSEREHLRAFARLVKHDPAMTEALKKKQWAKFARAYNGPDYTENQYHILMASAYSRRVEIHGQAQSTSQTAQGLSQLGEGAGCGLMIKP